LTLKLTGPINLTLLHLDLETALLLFQRRSVVMNKDVSKSFESHFGSLKDLRVERTKLYPLSEILFVVLTGSVCGAESWRDFVFFGEERLDFLQEYPVWRHFNTTMVAWAMRKYKPFKNRKTRAARFMERISHEQPRLFAHWRAGMIGAFA